jgi:hypothetical protein
MTSKWTLLLCLAAAPVIADEPPNQIIYGAGTETCGTFVSQSDAEQRRDIVWVLGYITAMGNGRKLNPTDYGAMRVWVTNYCQANPLLNLEKASWELSMALLAEASKQK